MEDISKKTIIETIDTAKEYASKLEDLIISIEGAKEQVTKSAQRTIEEIDGAFDLLSSVLLEVLQKRRNVLKSEVLKIQEEGLLPLRECHDVIVAKLKATHFLPAVPTLEEVPDVSLQCPVESVRTEIERTLSGLGQVSRMGPVQLTEVEEKPGALLVHWEEVRNYICLLMAYDDVRGQSLLESNFHDVYQGPECQFLVRDLRQGVPYTFRVSCRVEGGDWGAWSLPRVAATCLAPFCWDTSNSSYTVTNENKIATKTSTEQSLLFSSAAQFGPGHSIEFTILECGVGCSDEGLGLVVSRIGGESLLHLGALFLSTQGAVFVDGKEKTTRLPRLERGSKVCFTCEYIRENKIRVNIDSNNKTVTYDWNVSSTDLKLYFALCFGECGWKVLVE
ncbi:Cytokine receptor-like factor 3 [Blattella germanica]|nr:Cytokine receptor-like factor 3 [Blattella germanica]